ncbi:Neprilysin-11 [Hypsibius exemplaris]|uniref:Neprilysin-11 n=1 Tax=Hypsibius exemplaris TaxID=2072580 RepID=A0A1W0WRT2_HYPEX|nr:Neprilysin-11 [Hypsibius exemplaris]
MGTKQDADLEREKLGEGPKSSKAKYIALIILALSALTITFIVLYVQEVSKDPNEGKVDRSIKICLEPSCVTAAEHLNKAMNRQINPCDDFFEFACGGWNRTEPMPDDKARWSAFNVLDREMVRNLKNVLTTDKTLPDGTTATATEKMQKYFKSCVNTTAIEEAGVRELRNHLTKEYAGLESWPFLVNPGGAPIDVAKVLTTAFKYGNSLGLFSNYISGATNNSKINVINFDTGRFTLDRFSLLNDTRSASRAAYVQYGAEVAVLLAAEQGRAAEVTLVEAKALFERILAFEIQLANETLAPEDTRDETKLQNPESFASFANKYTSSLGLTGAKWVEIFSTAWPGSSASLTVDTVINVREPKYFAKLSVSATAVNGDKSQVLSNYLAWKVVEPLVTRLGAKYRDAYQKYVAVVSGATQAPPRAESCVAVVNGQFPNAIGSLYVRNFFRREAKAELQTMIEYLLNAFREIVKTSYWMEEETREAALRKANKIVARLAYDDYLMDNVTAVDDEHANFIAHDDYLLNFLAGRRFQVEVEGRLYLKGNDPLDWITGSAVVNAFYSPSHNSISFPAGILQAPFLGNGYPHYWNFAAIGTVIGHEITHAFDDQGAQTDGDGNLKNWWDPKSEQAFKDRAKTIIEQYSGYNLLGVQLKGENNQGENIADNGGLKESYNAYRMYRKEKLNDTDEPRLPGFETFNSDQMFYLSYAQVWCGDYRRQEVELQVNRAHSPGKFRIIGPLQNSEKFAQAYRCAKDTYMNPAKKAAVW